MKNLKYLLSISFIIFSSLNFAQNIDTVLQISEVEIYGHSINNNDKIRLIENNKSKEDVGKILKHSPNIAIIRRGNFATDPVIRGFKADQLQLLSNGFMQTNAACPNRMDAPSSHINMEDLEAIEIIKGPYSVRYGMNTGGILNFISKDPKSSEKFTVKGQAGLYYHTNGESKDGQANIQISDKKYALKIYGGLKEFGNYKSGNDTEILSSFKHNDYGAQGAWFINKHQMIIADWKQSYAKDVLFAALPMDGDFDNSSTVALRYIYKNYDKKIYKAQLKLYGNMIDHQMSNKTRPNTVIVNAVSKLQSQTYGAKGDLAYKVSDDFSLLFGADYKLIGKQGDRTREVFKNLCSGQVMDPPKTFIDAIWQDSKQSDLGLFVETDWELDNKWKWKTGWRVDLVNSEIQEPDAKFLEYYPEMGKSDDLAFMVNSRLKFKFTDQMFLEWSTGLGQRAPELIERYLNHLTVGMDAYEYVGNPDLEMEQNFQNDLKFKFDEKKVQVEVVVFYSILKNYIQANLDTTLSRKYLSCMEPKHAKRFENVEDARLYGFETLINYNFWKKMSVFGNIAYTIGENISMDEPLAEIPPMEINAGLAYNANKWFAKFNYRYVMAQDDVSASFNESTSVAFSVLDISAQYRIWKGLNLSVNVENLLDENYVEHLSRSYKNQGPATSNIYFEPGRNFMIGISYKF